MSTMTARRVAEDLVARLGLGAVPIDVKEIAERLGIQVVRGQLGTGVSGLLVSNADGVAICVQENDVEVRQRFTIAHELGHHVLRHQFEPGEHVHVDRGNFISQRGERASAGVDPKEIDANRFAAALLMPSQLLRQAAAAKSGNGPLLDDHVTALATDFRVSEQAMTIRLTSLGLL